MEKLSFDSLRADYKVCSEYIIQTEEHYCSSFDCTLNITALYNTADENYEFIINRSNVLINGKEATKLMDKIICEIGNALYPLRLKVSPLLCILNVMNFHEIIHRRKKCIEKLTDKYPAYQIERHIMESGKNFSGEQKFIHALYQNVFFNLYFRDIYTPAQTDEAFPILWANFPKRGMNRTYLYQIKAIDESQINTVGEIMKVLPEQQGHYDMMYEIGKYGEIHAVKGKITGTDNTKEYIKQVCVESFNLKTNTTKWGENIIL
jgi:hypothetical protein